MNTGQGGPGSHSSDQSAHEAFTDPDVIIGKAKAAALFQAIQEVDDGQTHAIDSYKLLQKLGEGGFGEVWAAEQSTPVRRKVALKIVKLGMDTKEVIARFAAERQALAMMDHPSIAKIFDAGTTSSGRPYFVMELVRGQRVTDFCRDQGLGIRARLELFIEICAAVQHAHQKGIIHRDIKPSNVLVTYDDHGKPTAKVIDFGIAKAMQQPLTDETLFTRIEQFIGTPAYVSPEQASAGPLDVDTRSDIYSLGVLFYELLVGQPPFDAATLANAGYDEMRRIIREVEPMLPSSRATDLLNRGDTKGNVEPRNIAKLLQGDLDWVASKALEKDRSRRYVTAAAFAEDVQRHLQGEPVQAAPPSNWYRLSKVVKRHRGRVIMAGLLGVSLVGGAIGTAWQGLQAKKQRNIAEESLVSMADAKQLADEMRQSADSLSSRSDTQLANYTVGRIQTVYRPEPDRAAALWARALRADPDNSLARAQLLKILLDEDFAFPLSENQAHSEVRAIKMSDDGRVAASIGYYGGGVRAWSTDGAPRLLLEVDYPSWPVDLALTSSGRRLYVFGTEHPMISWDLETGKQGFQFDCPDGSSGARAALSPQDRWVALASSTRRIHLLDVSQEHLEVLGQPITLENEIRSLAFDQQETKLAAATSANEIFLWDLQNPTSPRLAHQFQLGRRSIEGLDFDPSGKVLLAVAKSGEIQSWDTTSGAARYDNRVTHHGATVMKMMADGKRFITGSESSYLKVWTLRDGRAHAPRSHSHFGHEAIIWSLGSGGFGQLVASGSGDRKARLWNVSTMESYGGPIRLDGDVRTLAMSPNEQTLLTGTSKGTVTAWDIRPRKQRILPFVQKSGITQTTFLNESQVLSASTAGEIVLWNLHDGAALERFQHDASVDFLASGPDGRSIVAGTFDEEVTEARARIWFRESQAWAEQVLEQPSTLTVSIMSSDGSKVAFGDIDGRINVWSLANGEAMHTWVIPGKNAVSALAFDPAGDRLVVGLTDGSLRGLAMEATGSDSITFEILEAHSNSAQTIQIAPEAALLVSHDRSEESIKLWNPDTGESLREIELPDRVEFFQLLPDGTMAVAGNMINQWDLQTGKQVGEELKHFEGKILTMLPTSDGAGIVSTTSGTVCCWDLKNGERTWTISGAPSTIALADDDTTLAIGDRRGDLTVRLAPTASTRIAIDELIAVSEGLVGVRVGRGQSALPLTMAERQEKLRLLRSAKDPLISWLAEPLESRSVSPNSHLNARAYVSWLAREGSAEVSHDLLELSPMDKEAASELLDFLARFPETEGQGSIEDEFLWLLVRAIRTDPTPETLSRAVEIVRRGEESGMHLKEDILDLLERAYVDKQLLMAR